MTTKAESLTGQTFQRNGFYERLITMRRTDRKTFDGFSIPTRLALAEYEKQKRQYEQEKELAKN